MAKENKRKSEKLVRKKDIPGEEPELEEPIMRPAGNEDEGLDLSSDEYDNDEEKDIGDEEDEKNKENAVDDDEREIGEAVTDYVRASIMRKLNDDEVVDGQTAEDSDKVAIRDESDSSEDERPSRNTIGKVPLEWYSEEPHIGYDKAGKKIIKGKKKDKLDSFLDKADNEKNWAKIYDEYNDEEIVLTKEEIGMIKNLREGRIPHAEVNPYEPYVDWFDWDGKNHPLSNAPEPKRRFIPSKWEAKMVVRLVRAMRKGWIKLDKTPEKPKVYLLWGEDTKPMEKGANGLPYIPAPKIKLPGHEESYNPPVEYIPTEEEIKGYDLLYEEDRPKFIPKSFPSLRQVPAYKDFIKERFERCLDLYLCPRTRKNRLNIDPESLIPKLPKPKTLKPFPTTLSLEYLGHTGPVLSLSVDPTGQWLASGSSDCSVRVWEIATTRCRKVFTFSGRVRNVSFNPVPGLPLLAVAVENQVVILNPKIGNEEQVKAAMELISAATAFPDSDLVTWKKWSKKEAGISIEHKTPVKSVTWHYKGDYFSTLVPEGDSRSVLVHQLSKRATQNPFKRNHGRVESVLFHPNRPFLMVATRTHVRCYNLAKQQLAKKMTSGVQQISSMAMHPGGDNLIVGSSDQKVVWFDMDLSTKPYKTIHNHSAGVTGVAFHKTYPLFASASDDGAAHVFHGMVFADLLQNPLIVPVKVLRGHKVINKSGILDCVFHPRQPWLFTCGADSTIKLFCH